MTGRTATGFDVRFDEGRGMVLCRVTGAFSDAAQPEVARQITEVVAEARRQGSPLRTLWDNRLGLPLGPALTDIFRTILVDRALPDDRLAIVVSSSVEKARSRSQMAPGHQVFASENAALTWLSVGTSPVAA
ncbi:MAG TPA: hypothetical protein VF503_07150 [Sphingobium sp.]|uniref:hypothetical protein n=1 Tax=Sphingobium sp. TaxID=1912891 RepID=UPI002ED4BB7C